MPEDKLLGPGPGDPPAKKKVVDPWATPEKKKSVELQNKNKQDLKGGTTGTSQLSSKSQLPSNVVDPWSKEAPAPEPKPAANPETPGGFDLLSPEKIFEAPTVNVSGKPYAIWEAPPLTDKKTYAEGLQTRIDNKLYTPDDIQAVSKAMKISPLAADAHMRGKPAMGAVINYNDKREKARTELGNAVNDFNSRFTDKATDPGNFGGALTAKYGNAYDINDVLSTPEKTSAFLDKYRSAVEDTFNRKVKHGITVTGGSAKEADTTDYKGIEEAFGKNSAALAEKIVDDVLKENISKEQKVRKIATLVAKRDFQNSESAISERLDPVRYTLNAAFNNDTKETIDILNSVKANVEVGISRKTKDEIDYQSALKGAIIEQAMDQASKLTAGSKEAIAFIDGVNKQVDDIDLKIKELSKGYETEKQLEEKYPVLFKQKLVNKINDFTALRSGNIKGDENTPGFAKDDRSLQQFLADEGYDIYDQKVKDVLTGDNFKDYSFWGRPLQNFTDVFVNSYKSLADLTLLRDKADRMSEKKAAELFPTQVGENDQYQLTRAAGIGQNIGNTTGQIAGQGILQLATVGAGRLAGLSQVAAVRGAFWTSGTLTSFDSALKDSYDIADTEGGRLAYAGLIAMSNAVSERIFPDVKLFQIPGVAGHIADLSNRIGKPGFNIEMAKELLGKAKSAMVAYAKEGGKEVGQETAEEVITQLFEDGLRYLYGDPNATWDKAMQNAKNTAYQMATGMAAIGAYGAHKSVREERNTSAKGTLYNAALYHDEAMDALNKGFEQGLYSQDELNSKMSVLNTAKNALAVTDKTLTTLGAKMNRSEKSLYVANLTAEALLTKQLKDINTEEGVVDVILRTDVEEKIKNLQEQRAQLLKGDVKIDDNGNIVLPTYTVEGKPVKKDKFLEILNGPDANKYDLQVTGDDEVNDLLEKKGGKSEVVDEPKPKRKLQTDDQLATEILSTITGMPEKAETKKAIDYAIDKAVENPSLFEKDYPELFAKIKDRIPTKKIEESLDYHIDKMGDSPNVKILDDMLSERNKSETTTTEEISQPADDKGNPINEGSWYHGTPIEGISELKLNKNGLLFFTRDRGIAERYATNDYDGNTKSDNVFKRKLSVENIFDPSKNSDNNEIVELLADTGNFENKGRNPDYNSLAKQALEDGEWSVLETKGFIDGIKKLGYDAIFIDNRPYYKENAKGETTFSRDIAVFDAKQSLPSAISPEVIAATEAEIVEQKESVPVLHDLLQKSKNKDAALAAISQVNSQTLANLLDELPGSENDAIVEAFAPHMKDGKVDEVSLGKDIQEFGGLTSFLSEKLGKKINLKTLTQISNEISGQETETGDTKDTKGTKVAGPSTVSGGNLRSDAEEAKTDDKPKRTIPQSGNKVNAGDKNIKTKEPGDTKPEQVQPANVPGQQAISEEKKKVHEDFNKQTGLNTKLVGSVSRGEAKESSDIDIVLDGMPHTGKDKLNSKEAQENSNYAYDKLRKLAEDGVLTEFELLPNGFGLSFKYKGHLFQVVPNPSAQSKSKVPEQQKIKEAKVGATVAVPAEIEDKANGLLSALNDGRKGKDIYEIKNIAVTDNHYVLFAENKKGSKLFNIINSEGITPAGMAANWRTNGFKDDLDAISELENVAISPREYAKLSKLNEYTTSDGEIHPIVQVGDIVNYEGKAMEVTASNDPSQWKNDSLRDLNVPYFRGKEIGSKQDYLLHTNRIVAGQQKFAEENSILDNFPEQVAQPGELKGVTAIEYEDNGETLLYGTKNNKTRITVKGLSAQEVKDELESERDILAKSKRDVANFDEAEIMSAKGMTREEKEFAIKLNKQTIGNIDQVEKIVIPFYENQIKLKENEQAKPERSTDAITSSAEAIISEAETASEEEEVDTSLEKIEEALNEVESKIGKLTESWSTEDIEHEQPNKVIGKSVKKEITKYAKSIAKQLGWEIPAKNGIYDNIAPAGGDVVFNFVIPGTNWNMYVSAKYEPEDNSDGIEEYNFNGFFYRMEVIKPEKGQSNMGGNQWQRENIAAKEMAQILKREADKYVGKETKATISEIAAANPGKIIIAKPTPNKTQKQQEEEAIEKWLNEEYPNEDDIDEGYISFDWDGQILEVFQSRDQAPLEFTKDELIEKGVDFPKGAPKSAKAIQRKVRDEEGQKKIDSLIAKFMKGGSPLTMGGLDPERIEAGVELIGEYMKQGIYKFADIIEDFYAKAGDVAKEYFAALKTVYGAYRDGDATEKEYSQMDGNLRNFTYEDIIKSIQDGNDTIISDTNSEAAAGVVGNKSSGRTPGTKQRSSKAKGSSGTSGGMGEQDDTGIDWQGEESRRSSGGNERIDSGTDGRTSRGENDGQRTSEYQGQTARLKPIPENPSDQNHIIEPSDVIVPDGIPARVAANMDAIILLRTLEEEERNATPEEKKRLAKFVGWGGLAGYLKGIENDAEKTILDNIFLGTEQQVGYYDKTTIPATEKIEIAGKSFDDIAKEVQRKYAQIVSQFPRLTRLVENERALPLDVARSYSIPYLMNPAELQAAGNSTINAHYTDRSVITPIWDLIRKLGFKGGNTLESSAGVGHFFGLMPKDLQDNSNLTGVELDQLTGRILKKLYPDANIQVKGFEQTNFPNNSFDLAVSNVPFASLSVTDVKNKDIQGFSLHNYFIAKNLKQLKPGGIAVMITSKSTMDNAVSAKARRWFLSPEGGNSELVGAIRLPNNAFDKNAATQVTTDLLVFQKRRDNIVRNVNPFGTTTTIRSEVIDGELAEINVNEYYMANPDNMIGEMKFAFEVGSGGLYGKTDATLNAKPGTDIQGRIKELIDKFPTDILNTDVSEKDTSVSTNMKVGKMFSEKGKVYVSNGDQGYAPPFRKPEQNKIALAYLDVRDAIRDLVAKELTSATDEEIEKDRANLNKVYDAFVKKYGTINKNDFLYDHDVEFSIAAAAEDVKESTVFSSTGGKSKKHVEVKKAAIFSKRINYPRLEPTTADNLSDAIQISLAYRNHINPEYIAQITNQSVDEAIENMIDQKLVFQNPINGLFETPEEYLSGDVRKKLEEARNIAATDANYSRNVVELEKVQPEDKPISQIPFKMGVSWIPAKMYMEFIAEKLGVKINIAYLDKAGIWALDTDRMQGSRDSNNTTTYAVGGTTGIDIISDIMANRTTVINKTVSNGSGGTMQVKDEVSTSAAKDMQDKIIDEFRNWIATHSSYGSEIEKEYNNRFNNLVEKQYSLPPFKFFPGASTAMQLRAHQFKSVQRALSGNPLLLAHGVGTGKTAIMQTTAMEWRRLKTAKKPLIVVQNSTLKDFAAKFHKLYPGANLLVSSEADKGEAERRRFYARIAQGDWDAIIIPQSQFDRIPDNPDRVSAYLQERIEEMKQVLENTDDYFIKNRIQKEIEGLEDDIAKAYMTKDELAGLKTQAGEMYVDEETGKLVKGEAPVRTKSGKQKVKAEAEKILRLNARIQKQASRKTDNVMYFEDLGVDGLIVDEAHEYKKLGFQTGLQNIRGIDTGVSQKALSLYMKGAAVKEKTGGKNIVYATGTPITNTMAESWTMMRFLQPEALQEMGIQYFDQFAATFTEVVPSLEQNAGGRFEVVQRMKEFVNAKQLQAIFKRMADVVTTDDIPEFLSDPNNAPPQLEGGKFKAVLIPISKPMEATMKRLTQEYDNWKESTGAEKKEKSWLPLVLYQVAKKAAIDLRIIDPRNIDDPESKVNYAVRNALEIYREFDEYKGTQMIFADNFQSGNSQIVQSILGVPTGLTPFNLYHDIKEKLIANGVPAKEIIIMSDVKTDSGKLAMQDKMNSGEVRFVLGSTSKMGIGVNAHERMIALHHIDAPDRPDQFTQRNGRILRSGNMFTKLGIPVKVLTYGIKDTRDATSYGRLRDKDKFVTDFMTGKGGDRVEDTGEENESEGAGDFFSQMSAQLSGSKFATELIFAEKDLRTESNRSQAFYQKRRESEYKLSNKISGREEIITLIKQADEAVVIKNEHFPNNKITALTIDGKDIGEKTTEAVDNMIDSVSKEYKSEAKRLQDRGKGPDEIRVATPKPILKKFKINGVDSTLQYSGGIFGDGDMAIFIPSLSLDGKVVSSGASLLSVVRNYVKDLDDQPQRYRDLLAKEEANIETLKRNLQDTYDDTRLEELIKRVDYLKAAILQESEEKKAADKKEKEDAAALAKVAQANTGTLLSTKEGANAFQTSDDTPVSLDALKKKYPTADIVQSQTDLPSEVQEVAQQNQLTVEGVLHNGKVYLVADNLATMGRAEGVYRHERIGHASVIAHLKDKLDGFARSLVNNATKAQTLRLEAMAQALYKKPIAELSIEEKSILGQEYIAQAAENPAKSPITWEKVVAFVRGVLRNLGIKLAVSDKDIKVLLDRAAKTQNTAPNATRFSPTEKKIKLPDGTTVTGQTRQHSVDITPSIKSQVKKGQPLFSIVGEKAKLDAYVKDNLDVARVMEKDGKDADTIFLATGWERGKDNKWRYEIPDAKMKSGIDTEALAIGNIGIKLSDFANAEDLFTAYPQLKNAEVYFSSELKGAWGDYSMSYSPLAEKNVHTIRLSKELANPLVKEKANSVLLHEIQHGIQRIEGFSTGSSPESLNEPPSNIYGKIWKLFDMDTIGNIMADNDIAGDYSDENPVNWLRSKLSELMRAGATDEEIKTFSDIIQKGENKATELWDQNVGSKMYRKLSGEVEARNVQVRAGLTNDERRKIKLSSTEDVAREDQVKYFGTDPSYSTEMQDNLRKAREAAAKAEAKAAKKASNIPADLKEFGDEFISYTKRKKADATADDVIGEMESERGTSFTDTEAPGLFDYIRSQFAGEEQQQPETPPVPPADKVNVSGTDEEVIRRVLERNIDDKEYPAYFTENETLKQDAAKTQGAGQDRFVDGAYVQAHLGDLRSISLENARILQNALGAKWKNKVVQFFEANPNAGNMAQVAGMLNVISTDVFNELAKTRNGNKVSELKYLQSRIDRIALSNARTASLTLNQRRLYQGFAQDKPISELLAEIILTPEQRNIKQGVEQSMKKEFTDAELNHPVPKQKQPATPKPPKEKQKPDPTSKIKKDLIARGQMAQQQEDGTGNVKKVTLADKIKQAADALKGFKC